MKNNLIQIIRPFITLLLFTLIILVPGNAQTQTAAVKSKTHSLFLTAGPMILVNTASKTESSPAPIMFSCGFGENLFENKSVQFQPRLSFFTNYYLWADDMALPAEIENRTALVLSFMTDLPVVYSWKLAHSTFQAGVGIGILARFAVLAAGLSSSDKNSDDETRTAGEDVDSINSWLWSNGRYLYPELVTSWTHTTTNGWRAGFELRAYLPVGSLLTGRKLDAAIVSGAIRLLLPEK